MTIPSSGALSFATIQNEFKLAAGATNLNMNAYKSVNRFAPSTDVISKFPTTNIKFSDFYGKSKYVLINLSGSTYNFVASTYVLARGWDGVSSIGTNVTVTGDVFCTDPTKFAFDTGTFPSGSVVDVIINPGSYIIGKGGAGGDGTPAVGCGFFTGGGGGDGGHAFRMLSPTRLTNNGTIAGGGGGGGGGGEDSYWNASAGAGGGGAGFGNVGIANGCGVTEGRFGSNGNPGNQTTGGLGGTGGNQFVADGGNGGSLASAGSVGQTTYTSGGSGGQPGYSITFFSNYIGGTTGTLLGLTASGAGPTPNPPTPPGSFTPPVPPSPPEPPPSGSE
jgi:hypothetical protein